MAKSDDNLKDLTVALKGLVENLNNSEQGRVNNTNVSPQQFKADKYVPSLKSLLHGKASIAILVSCNFLYHDPCQFTQ